MLPFSIFYTTRCLELAGFPTVGDSSWVLGMSQVGCFREHKNEGQDGQPSQPPYMKAQPEVAKQRRQEPETGRVVRDWENRHRWLYRVLAPPRPVYANPREKEIETDYPLGRWNLYIGGAGNRVPGYVNVDLVGLPGVTVVGNAEALPFASHRFTRVECDAVLEHVEQPDRVIAEIDRCLEPGGLAHFVVPFCHPLHEYPRDFRRFTPDGLKLLCANLEVVAEGWRSGPTATWMVFTLEFAKSWCRSRLARRGVHFLLGWLLFPLRYLDKLLLLREGAAVLGNHYYLYARKTSGRTRLDGT